MLGLSALAGAARGGARRARVACAAGSKPPGVLCVRLGAPRRILVMGGTRFIGCYLVSKLRQMGHQVAMRRLGHRVGALEVVCNRGKTNGGKPERLPGVSDAEYQQMLQAQSLE